MTDTLPDVPALLRARYGRAAPEITDPDILASETLRLILNHHTVRTYSDRVVSDEHIAAIVAAAQSASSSSNNQSWSVVEVRDAGAKRRLVYEAGGSAFIAHAPVVLVFVADWARATAIAGSHGAGSEAVGYLESTLVAFVDAGIAAQSAVLAAEALGLGTSYLGSLRNHPEAAADIVGLPQGAAVAFGVALGWPADSAGIKPRLAPHVVHAREHYREVALADAEAYDEELARYNASQARAGTSWIAAVTARVRDLRGLHGRETARAALERRGLPSR
ncbi:nitroreductase family protein [Microbacterium phosphatis]|uniref:nitroreductase family protein n=1 Tax=Microbacterium phosphatis TaxID=3140248 RepID=UPI0031406E0E